MKVDPLTRKLCEDVDDIKIQTAITECRQKYQKIDEQRGEKRGIRKISRAARKEKSLTIIRLLKAGVPREAIQKAMNMSERDQLVLPLNIQNSG
jgi:hypothetical protein